MTQIKPRHASGSFADRFSLLRHQLTGAIKWWAEHQAWPATEDVRIERARCR